MSRVANRYHVRKHDNILRFRVASRSRPDIEHVVDVSENNGIGQCSCEHFQFRLQPAIDRNVPSTRSSHRCPHIVAARETCLDNLIQIITAKAQAATEAQQNQNNEQH